LTEGAPISRSSWFVKLKLPAIATTGCGSKTTTESGDATARSSNGKASKRNEQLPSYRIRISTMISTMSETNLEKVIANFDGMRRREYRRLPVLRRCSGCKRLFLIAMVFDNPVGRFRLQHCHPSTERLTQAAWWRQGMDHVVTDSMRRNIVERLTWSFPECVGARTTSLGRIAGVYLADRAPEFAR
jgi:hypothetical protein